jgi:hypothetical protein
MRRILFFTGQRMLAYHWSANRFRVAHVFEPDPQGYQDFELFLQATPKQPVRLMVDIIEEGFRVESMPRAFGGDRKSLTQRLLARHFRTTSYRHLTVQGRQKTGRRDLRVLISGLTNPELLHGWVEIINRNQVPLEGVYSLPLAGEWLLPCIKADKTKTLLITQQSPGAVRQSFYDRGQLQLSRLIPIRYEGEEGYAGFVSREVNNTLRFLESQRLMRRNERMYVHIISPVEHLAELQRGLFDQETIQYEIWDYRSVARRLHVRGELPTEFADGLFAQLLCRRAWPGNHYATSDMRTHHFHRQARSGLYGASLALLLVAAMVGGAKLLEGRLFESYTLAARVEAVQYQRQYDELLREISSFPLQAAYVKDAVDLVRELDESVVATPERLMSLVGGVLNRHPNITVREMRWVSDAEARVSLEKQAQSRRGRRDDEFVAGERYQIALIKGQVTDFGRSYRGAVSLFGAFVNELRSDGRFSVVEVQRTPFDIDPQAAITGSSGLGASTASRERAGYELLLRIKHGDEQA